MVSALSLPDMTSSITRNMSGGVILATHKCLCLPQLPLLLKMQVEGSFLPPALSLPAVILSMRVEGLFLLSKKCLCLPQPLPLLETQAEKLFLLSISVSAYHDPSIASGGVLAIHIVSACCHHPLLLEMQAERLFLPPTLSQPATILSIT